MYYILAGLSGVIFSTAIYIPTGEAGWRMLLSAFLLILGIRIVIELVDLEKMRNRNMEEVASGGNTTFEQAREMLLSIIESSRPKRDGRIIANIRYDQPSGMYTWSLQREKVKNS